MCYLYSESNRISLLLPDPEDDGDGEGGGGDDGLSGD